MTNLNVLENQVEHTYDLLKLTCELVKKPEAKSTSFNYDLLHLPVTHLILAMTQLI